MWLHIKRKQWKTGSYTWTFLYIVGASASTSHDITKAPNGTGFDTHSSDGLAPCWVAEKLQLLTGARLEGSVTNCCLLTGILLPLLCCLVVDEIIDGLNGNGYYTLGMCYPNQWKIHKYCLTASSGGFEYGTTVVRYNSDTNPSTKGSAPVSISYETRSLRWNLFEGHWPLFKVRGC